MNGARVQVDGRTRKTQIHTKVAQFRLHLATIGGFALTSGPRWDVTRE